MTNNATQQKKYKPLIFTGVIPVVRPNNRVHFMNGNSVAIGKYCSLYGSNVQTTFDPALFCVMVMVKPETDPETKVTTETKIRFIADLSKDMLKQYVQLQNRNSHKKFTDSLIPGQKVHLFSKEGMYKIVQFIKDRHICRISCQIWEDDYKRDCRKLPYEDIYTSDIKCLAGGLHNAVFT